jgi:hypothetical protein
LKLDDLLAESQVAEAYFWFIEDFYVNDRTDQTITLHFIIGPELFVQIFYSARSDRFSLALIGSSGRLYGRDREHGYWHLHPFGQSGVHQPTPEGMSPRPVIQFLTEVEKLLVDHDLL